MRLSAIICDDARFNAIMRDLTRMFHLIALPFGAGSKGPIEAQRAARPRGQPSATNPKLLLNLTANYANHG